MLDNHPILKDRLQALGVFTGIAIAAVSGFEMVIGGGLDFITPGQAIREVAPSAYVQVADRGFWSDANVVQLASNEPMFVGGDYMPATAEELAGGADDRDAPAGRYPQERSFEDIEADIAALYAEVDSQDYTVDTSAAEAQYVETPYVPDEAVDPKQRELELQDLTAYENGLPS